MNSCDVKEARKLLITRDCVITALVSSLTSDAG